MSKSPIRNVPPPQGKAPRSAYTRFIPREELGSDVKSWAPGAFADRRSEKRPDAPEQAVTSVELQGHIDRERQAARQAGYQDGYRDGLAALDSFKQHFAQQATAQVGALLDGFDSQLRALDSRIAARLARCAVQIARQVVRSELAARPQLVAQVATEAVDAVMLSARHIAVHVHPADLPLVAEGADEALRARGARLVADETLARGGVRVESDAGAVDARIETRWAQAASALLGRDDEDETEAPSVPDRRATEADADSRWSDLA